MNRWFAISALAAGLVSFTVRGEIAAGDLSLSFGVDKYTTCVPVITATFPAGATRVAVEWCKTADGTFAELGAVANPEGTTFVYTNSIALVADKRWYRIAATDGDGTTCSAATAYTRFRQLERDPKNQYSCLNSGCKLLVSGAYLPFDGNTGTYYDNSAYATIGINFSRRWHIAGCRFLPRYNNTGRASNRYYYGATSAENYSAGTKVSLGYIPGLTAYTWTFVPSTDTTNAYQCCWMVADNGNLSEMQIYGWTPDEDSSPVGHAYFEVVNFSNCVPVVTWTFEAGADSVALEIGKTANGTFTALTTIDYPVGISAVYTNTSAKVGVKRYYRVAVTKSGSTVYSTPVAYTRYRRLERDPANGETVRLSKYTYMQVNGFDGSATTYTAFNPIGVNFNEQVYFAAFRTRPRPSWAARLTGYIMYASSTAADYSSGVKVEIGGPDLAFDGQFQLMPSHDLENAYQYCYISPNSGNLDEMQVYGWDAADIEASGDAFYPTALTAFNGDTLGKVDVAWSGGKNITSYDVQYREQGAEEWTTAASGLAGSVETNTVAGLAAGKTYAFRVKGYGADETGYSPTATVYVYHLVPGSGTGLNTAVMGPITTRQYTTPYDFEYRVSPTVDIDVTTNTLFSFYSNFSALVVYRGKLIVPLDGTYTLSLTTAGTDGSSLYVDGVQKFNAFSSAGYKYTTVALTAGEHDIEINYRSVNNKRYLKFMWALENVWGEKPVPQSQFIPASDDEIRAYETEKCEGWDFSIATGADYIPHLQWLGKNSFRMRGESADYSFARLALLTRSVKGEFDLYADFDSAKNVGRPGLFLSAAGTEATSVNFICAAGQLGMKGVGDIDWGGVSWTQINSGTTKLRIRRLADNTVLFQAQNSKWGDDWHTCLTMPHGTLTYNSKTLDLTGRTLIVGFSQFGAIGTKSDVTVTNFHLRHPGLKMFLK